MSRVYNRYIPQDTDYIPAGRQEQPREQVPGPGHRRNPLPGAGGGAGNAGAAFPPRFPGREKLEALLSPGRGEGGISALLKSLKLGSWDSGDLLLLLIILLLLSEGDDLELVIALGLALMMGLGEAHDTEDRAPPAP